MAHGCRWGTLDAAKGFDLGSGLRNLGELGQTREITG